MLPCGISGDLVHSANTRGALATAAAKGGIALQLGSADQTRVPASGMAAGMANQDLPTSPPQGKRIS
jgi:hypothetical protein